MEHYTKCLYCDRAEKARGLCSGHYARWWNKLPMDPPLHTARMATCHPDRPHFGKGLCKQCYYADRMRHFRSKPGVKIKHAVEAKLYRKKIKEEFISEYGGKCACCGETEVDFLTLEHKRKNGRTHRLSYSTTTQMLIDLKKRGWPKDDYEINCYNCNMGSKLGICPHKRTNE